jgi:hypothetical protein
MEPFVLPFNAALIGRLCSLDGPGHLFDPFPTVSSYCIDLGLFQGYCLGCPPNLCYVTL